MDKLLSEMGGDYSRHRTESLLKQKTLAEIKLGGVYKLKSKIVTTEQKERLMYIHERGVGELQLKKEY
jgi:hypothetical protein